MKHHIFKILSFRKIGLSTAVILVLSGMSVMSTDASFKPNPLYPARNVIVYEHPMWAGTGTILTNTEVARRFSVILYAHNQMKQYLSGYRNAGFNGDAMVYLIADSLEGPQGLSSVTAQNKTCTENGVNPNTDVYSNHAAMDTGDFCEIHDAIVRTERGTQTCLTADGYPDICPTENWFLHKSDGSRYERRRSSTSGYQPNPGDLNWQKYFARRSLRELVANYQTGYDYVSNIDGLFIDNLELSWGKVYNAIGTPKEYTSDCNYTKAVRNFASYVHTQLHSGGYSYPVWANMISDSTNDPCSVAANSWIPYENYLEGGMDESFILNWGRGPYGYGQAEREMDIGSYWTKKGKHFMTIIQGNSDRSYDMYAFAAYLMTTDGVNGSYYYSDQSQTGGYKNYYTMSNSNYPDYNYPLGQPLGDKYLSNSTAHEWKRNYQCGQVTVNLTNHTGSISLNSNCSLTSPTPTVRPSNTPTARPTNTTTPIPLKQGDANEDGKVDLLDYVIWLNHLGATTANKYKDGDFNTDGKVDLLDYIIWLNNFGK